MKSLTDPADPEEEAAVAEVVLRRFVLLRPLERRQLLPHPVGQRIAWKILERHFTLLSQIRRESLSS